MGNKISQLSWLILTNTSEYNTLFKNIIENNVNELEKSLKSSKITQSGESLSDLANDLGTTLLMVIEKCCFYLTNYFLINIILFYYRLVHFKVT